MSKVLGIIGGMGPLSSVKLFERIVLLTDANKDQDHLHIIIDNNTTIPDRTDYILGVIPDDPSKKLIESAVRLQSAGADFLVICCNTAHYFLDQIVASIDIPILSIIEETAKYIKDNHFKITEIGLLSTEATAEVGLYDNVFKKYGIDIIKPTIENQKYITDIIYNIKKGIENIDFDGFYITMEEMKERGVDLFILGCTELPVAVGLYNLIGNFIDPLEILAIKSIEYSGKSVIK